MRHRGIGVRRAGGPKHGCWGERLSTFMRNEPSSTFTVDEKVGLHCPASRERMAARQSCALPICLQSVVKKLIMSLSLRAKLLQERGHGRDGCCSVPL